MNLHLPKTRRPLLTPSLRNKADTRNNNVMNDEDTSSMPRSLNSRSVGRATGLSEYVRADHGLELPHTRARSVFHLHCPLVLLHPFRGIMGQHLNAAVMRLCYLTHLARNVRTHPLSTRSRASQMHRLTRERWCVCVYSCRMYNVIDACHVAFEKIDRNATDERPVFLHVCGILPSKNRTAMMSTMLRFMNDVYSWHSDDVDAAFRNMSIVVTADAPDAASRTALGATESAQMSDMQAKIDALTTTKTLAQASIESLQSQNANMQTIVASLKRENENVKALNLEMEETIASQTKKINRQETSIVTMDELRKEVATLTAEVSALETKNADMQTTLRTLTGLQSPLASAAPGKRPRDAEEEQLPGGVPCVTIEDESDQEKSDDDDKNCPFRCQRGCGGWKRTATSACKKPCYKGSTTYEVPARLLSYRRPR